MPWSTPTLRDVRSIVRDNIRASLPGADASVPNSVLRVLSDAQGGLAHLTLQYLDWLALQLIPDTAEREWLDRHADIWLINSDGTLGRKQATLAHGTVEFTGFVGTTVPASTRLEGAAPGTGITVGYETVSEITIGDEATAAEVRALDAGVAGNLEPGSSLSLLTAIANVDNEATVVELSGGVETETDEQLRARVLRRIRQPPMGGAAHDYVNWALAMPGVTRAWCNPLEMGIGTVTVRFMMDEVRAANGGFPTPYDCTQLTAYLDTVRPVAVKDVFVVAPIPQRVDVYILDLVDDTESVRAAIENSLTEMLLAWAAPGQTIFAAWKYSAIMATPGVVSFALRFTADDVMQSPGHMAVLGDIVYDVSPPAA